MSGLDAVDLFAGAGGASVALARTGHARHVGIEWDAAACRAAADAGHARIRADVAALDPRDYPSGGLWGSPPCQAWSRAGQRGGLADAPAILAHVDLVAATGRWEDWAPRTWADERSRLVLEPLRWAMATRPDWVALEQVPDVLPLWERVAAALRAMGYWAWAGVLSAERYGVPQVRKRAILLASRTRAATPPAPTHTAYRPELPDRGKKPELTLWGDPLRPWVSMADALGWGHLEAPSATVTAGGTDSGGGSEPIAHWQRAIRDRGPFVMRSHHNSAGVPGRRPTRGLHEPALTVQTSPAHWALCPAGTSWERHGQNRSRPRPLTEPAPTLTATGPTLWPLSRPATTVQTDPRIAPPGHRDRAGGERQYSAGTVRVTAVEAGVLQGFPADYPWHGTLEQQYAQAGNAVPPPLAEACIRAVL